MKCNIGLKWVNNKWQEELGWKSPQKKLGKLVNYDVTGDASNNFRKTIESTKDLSQQDQSFKNVEFLRMRCSYVLQTK